MANAALPEEPFPMPTTAYLKELFDLSGKTAVIIGGTATNDPKYQAVGAIYVEAPEFEISDVICSATLVGPQILVPLDDGGAPELLGSDVLGGPLEPEEEETLDPLDPLDGPLEPLDGGLLDPDAKNRWFAMEIEFKLVEAAGGRRDLLIKQARPYNFGDADIPADCRDSL